MMRRLACALALLLAAGSTCCANADGIDLRGLDQPPEPVITDAQLAPYLGSGPATISGRVFARLPGVATEYYVNTVVSLWPAIPYANWLIDDYMRESVGAFHLKPGDAATHKFDSAIRTVRTDSQGHFSFANVAAEPYVVFVPAQDSQEREQTLYREEVETIPVYDSQDGSMRLEQHYNSVPYQSPYACRTYGWLYGAITGVAGENVLTSLAMMYSTNDGC